MNHSRLPDLLGHIQQAAADACSFIVGEAATKVMDQHAEFAEQHPQVPWRSMRGMRNRIAHGYFDIDLDVVWGTVQTALPELLALMPAVCDDAGDGDRSTGAGGAP